MFSTITELYNNISFLSLLSLSVSVIQSFKNCILLIYLSPLYVWHDCSFSDNTRSTQCGTKSNVCSGRLFYVTLQVSLLFPCWQWLVIFTLVWSWQKHFPVKASFCLIQVLLLIIKHKGSIWWCPWAEQLSWNFPADAGFLHDKTAVLMATIVQTTKEERLLTPITIFKAPSPDQKKKSILTRTKFVSKQLKHLKIQNILK